jgi:hypothetical protein
LHRLLLFAGENASQQGMGTGLEQRGGGDDTRRRRRCCCRISSSGFVLLYFPSWKQFITLCSCCPIERASGWRLRCLPMPHVMSPSTSTLKNQSTLRDESQRRRSN